MPDSEQCGPPTALVFDVTRLAGLLAPSSIAIYRRDVAAYLDFAHQRHAAPLDPATLSRWRTHLAQETQQSPNTINRMLSAVKRVVREAAAQGYTDHETASAFDQVKGVKASVLRGRAKPHARTKITPAQMRQLCAAPDQQTLRGMRDAALLATLASSGVRVAELALLQVTQIHAKDGGYLLHVVGKGQAEPRDAPLSREAYGLITQWLAQRPVTSSYVFTGFGGRGLKAQRALTTPLNAASVWKIVQGYADLVGLAHIKPHDFRRFVGTQLAARDLRQAQKALGHKRIDTTVRHYVLDELAVGLTDDLY